MTNTHLRALTFTVNSDRVRVAPVEAHRLVAPSDVRKRGVDADDFPALRRNQFTLGGLVQL